MRKLLIPLLLAAVVLGTANPAEAARRRLTPRERAKIERILRDAARIWHLDPQRFLAVGSCESGWRWWVGDRYRGVFQHDRNYYAHRRDIAARDYHRRFGRWPAWRHASAYDARANAYTAASMVARTGYGSWPNCKNRRW